MTAEAAPHLFNFVHHHHHPLHPAGDTRLSLRRKLFRKRVRPSVLGGGGGDQQQHQHQPYDSDSTDSIDVFDYPRNKRSGDGVHKKEDCSSHDEVETIVGDDDDSSGDETVHSDHSVAGAPFCVAPFKVTPPEEEQLPPPPVQQPCAPPLSPASSFTSGSALDNRSLRSEFIAGLVDFADELISSIWQKPQSDAKGPADCVIPMRQFIQEVLRRSQSSYGTLSLALYYLGRASRRPLPQHLKQQVQAAHEDATSPKSEFPWCKCSRRMFLAALILATKFLHDRAYTNRAWAKLAGLSTREVGLCERALLEWLNWELYVHPRVFVKWQSDIFKRVRSTMSAMGDASSDDQSEVVLQMMQVSIDERHGPAYPPTPVDTQQPQQPQLAVQGTASIDAQIRSIVAMLQPPVGVAAAAAAVAVGVDRKRRTTVTCAQETTYEVQTAKRSRVV